MTKTNTDKSMEGWRKQFVELINNWRTFGGEEDPENFEPYITFDRKYQFDGFMKKATKLHKQFIQQALAEQREEILKAIPKAILYKGNYDGVDRYDETLLVRADLEELLADARK